MSLFDQWSTDDLGSVWDTAADWGSSFNQPRGSETATSSALQSMQPVDTNANGGNWGSFFQGLIANGVGYALQRDQMRNGYAAQQPTNSQQVAQAYLQNRQPAGLGMLLPLALVGGVIFLAVKAAK